MSVTSNLVDKEKEYVVKLKQLQIKVRLPRLQVVPVVKVGYKLHVGPGVSNGCQTGDTIAGGVFGLSQDSFSDAHIAYLRVHSRAVASYLARSDLYWLAMSGTRGSSGFASVSRELIESKTFETVSAGDH